MKGCIVGGAEKSVLPYSCLISWKLLIEFQYCHKKYSQYNYVEGSGSQPAVYCVIKLQQVLHIAL